MIGSRLAGCGPAGHGDQPYRGDQADRGCGSWGSLVPLCSVTGGYALPGLVVRPLRPELSWTLGLIQRRDKPDEPALRCVREALLTLADR